jgi:hypothetical protein
LDFKRNGNRTCYEKLYFCNRTALISLALAECIEGADWVSRVISVGVSSLEEGDFAVLCHLATRL